MGYNIACIAINRNISGHIESFFENNDIKVHFSNDYISLETAFEGGQSEEVDVYFTESGTLLFIPDGMCLIDYVMANTEVMAFCYYDTVSAYSLYLTNDYTITREIMEAQGELLHSKGDLLHFETDNSVLSDWIEDKVEEMIGLKLFSYNGEGKCLKYIITSIS
jgi:hypothetical protein